MSQVNSPARQFQFFLLALATCLVVAVGCERNQPPEVYPGNTSRSELEGKSNVPYVSNMLGQPADSDSAYTYSVMHWNVESGGNEPTTIAAQLVNMITLGNYDVIGLSEVEAPGVYKTVLGDVWPGRYQVIEGLTGANEERDDDHLWMAFDKSKFELVETSEMKEDGGFVFDDGHHRVPLYAKLKDKSDGMEIIFLMNHFARGNKDFRQSQAKTLREWARTKQTPIVAIGDYNLDFEFATQKGNPAFTEMMRDNVWAWVRPEPLVDTNWSDRDGDGVDNYIDSLLDFSFVAGAAKEWKNSSRVIVRDGDFPDNERTSDHRPVELFLTK